MTKSVQNISNKATQLLQAETSKPEMPLINAKTQRAALYGLSVIAYPAALLSGFAGLLIAAERRPELGMVFLAGSSLAAAVTYFSYDAALKIKDYENPKELREMRAKAQFPEGRPSFIQLAEEHGLKNLRKYEIAPLSQLQDGLIKEIKSVNLAQFFKLYPDLSLSELRTHGLVTEANWQQISTL